jgi:hypothetical protein
MDKKFLYTKPSVPGIIDDSEADLDLSSWFLKQTPFDLLKEELNSCKVDDLVIQLVQIFIEGNPNYQKLLALLGSGVEKMEGMKDTTYSLKNFNRPNNDIFGVEVNVDNINLKIRKLLIQMKGIYSLELLKFKLNTLFKNLRIEFSSKQLVVCGLNDADIVLINQ